MALLLVGGIVVLVVAECAHPDEATLQALGIVGFGGVGMVGGPYESDQHYRNPLRLLPEVVACVAGLVGVAMGSRVARASRGHDSAVPRSPHYNGGARIGHRPWMGVIGLLLTFCAALHCNIFTSVYVLAASMLAFRMARADGYCDSGALLALRRCLWCTAALHILAVGLCSAPGIAALLPHPLLSALGITARGVLFSQSAVTFAILEVLVGTRPCAEEASPTQSPPRSPSGPGHLPRLPSCGSCSEDLEACGPRSSVRSDERAGQEAHPSPSSRTGTRRGTGDGSGSPRGLRRRGGRPSRGRTGTPERLPPAMPDTPSQAVSTQSPHAASWTEAALRCVSPWVWAADRQLRGSSLLPLASSLIWAMTWPSVSTLPMLLGALALMHFPVSRLPQPVVHAALVYQLLFGVALYCYNIYSTAHELPLSRIPAAFTDFERAGLQSYLREGNASNVLAHMWYVASQAIAAILFALSARAQRARAERPPAPWNSLFVVAARSAAAYSRPVTVLVVLSFALSTAGLSLVGFGYILWILSVLISGCSRSFHIAGWDVLRGHMLVWRALLLYSNGIVVALFSWQIFAKHDQELFGMQRTAFSLVQTTLPHLVISALAAFQTRALQAGVLQPIALLCTTSPLAWLLWVSGMFMEMSLMFLVVMLPPKSLDSFLFLLLFIGVVAVEQFRPSSPMRVRLLAAVGLLSCLLLPLRYAIVIPAVRGALARMFPPDQNALVWDSFALEDDVRVKIKLFVLVPVAVLAFGLRRIFMNPTCLQSARGEVLMRHPPILARVLKEGARWSMSILMFIAYFLMQKHDAASLLQITLLLVMLVHGRYWEFAGAMTSVCSTGLLLAQYWFDLNYMHLNPEVKAYWGLAWEWSSVGLEVALLFLGIVQRSVQRAARHLEESRETERESAQMRILIRTELAAYGAHIAAALMMIISLFRSSAWSALFVATVVVFRLSGDSARSLSPARTNGWLRLMAVVQALAFFIRLAVEVWFPAGVVKKPTVENLAASKFCAWVGDFHQQRMDCALSWEAWLDIQDEHTRFSYSFIALWATCLLRHLCLAQMNAKQAQPRAQLTSLPSAMMLSNAESATEATAGLTSPGSSPSRARSAPSPSLSSPAPPPRARSREAGARRRRRPNAAAGSSGDEATPAQEGEDSERGVSRWSALRTAGILAAALTGGTEQGTSPNARVPSRRWSALQVLLNANESTPQRRRGGSRSSRVDGWSLLPHAVYGTSSVLLWLSLGCASLSQPQTSAITIGYMLLLFVHLIVSESTQTLRDPFAARSRVSRLIRTFNLWVCVLFVLFQCPFVPCPFEKTGDPIIDAGAKWWSRRQLMTASECVDLQHDYDSNFDFGAQVFSQNTRLSIIMQCVGLRKSDDGFTFDWSIFWTFIVFTSSLVQALALSRWATELSSALEAQGQRFLLREHRYIDHLVRWRRLELSRIDTKHEVLLEKLEQLIRYLNEVRAVWASQRERILPEEKEAHERKTRELDLCLWSGAPQREVRRVLQAFDAVAQSVAPVHSHEARRRIGQAVDACVLEQLELYAREELMSLAHVKPDRVISERLLHRCASKVALAVGEAVREEQEERDRLTAESTNSYDRRKEEEKENQPAQEASWLEQARTQVRLLMPMIKAPIRRAYEFVINDFLFVREGDRALHSHRLHDGVPMLIVKALLSQTFFFLFCAAVLQFSSNMSIFSTVTVCAILLSLMVFPHPPHAFWKGLQIYNLSVIAAKMVYQLPNIPAPDTTKTVPWESVLGLLKVCPSGSSTERSYQQVGSLLEALWADLLVCAFLFCHWHALRQSGHLGDPGVICGQLAEDDRLEESRLQPPPSPAAQPLEGPVCALRPAGAAGYGVQDADVRGLPALLGAGDNVGKPGGQAQRSGGDFDLPRDDSTGRASGAMAALSLSLSASPAVHSLPPSPRVQFAVDTDSIGCVGEDGEGGEDGTNSGSECGDGEVGEAHSGDELDIGATEDTSSWDDESFPVPRGPQVGSFVSRTKDVIAKFAVGGHGLRKPAMDLYTPRLTISVLMLLTVFFFWSDLTTSKRSFADAFVTSAFSGSQVGVVTLLLVLIVHNRAEYTWYTTFTQQQRLINDPRSSQQLPELSASPEASPGPPPQAPKADFEDIKARYMPYLAPMLQKVLLVMQLVTLHVLYIHMWTKNAHRSPAMSNAAQKIFYTLYIAYLALTSMQLKYDVHVVRGGLGITHSTDLASNLAFKVYIAVPFVEELRVLADWTFTKTSLDFFQWMKLEDAHQSLYRTARDMLVRRMIPRADPRPTYEKFFMGGCLLIAIVVLIVGPIGFFSTLNPTLRTNEVVQATLTAQLNVNSPGRGEKTSELYRAGQARLAKLSSDEVIGLDLDPSERDAWEVDFPKQSDTFWLISSSMEEQLAEMLSRGDSSARIDVKLAVDLSVGGSSTSTASGHISMNPDGTVDLLEVLNETFTAGWSVPVSVGGFGEFPAAVHIDSRLQMAQSGSTGEATLSLSTPQATDAKMLQLPYWRLSAAGDKGVKMFIDTERVAPSFSGPKEAASTSTSGVLAIYATFVFTIGRFLRFVFQDSSKRMIYEELPDTRLLLDLCNGIYIARIQGLLEMEYKLYYQLVQIYRSPELLFDISRSPDNHTTPNGPDERAPPDHKRPPPRPPQCQSLPPPPRGAPTHRGASAGGAGVGVGGRPPAASPTTSTSPTRRSSGRSLAAYASAVAAAVTGASAGSGAGAGSGGGGGGSGPVDAPLSIASMRRRISDDRSNGASEGGRDGAGVGVGGSGGIGGAGRAAASHWKGADDELLGPVSL